MKQLKALLLVPFLFVGAFPEEPDAAYNLIDGFTSATLYRSLHIYPSRVYSDRAEIQWSEMWEYDSNVTRYEILWGTEEGDYTNNINLLHAMDTGITPVTVGELKPATRYYLRFLRRYKGNDNITNFTFTTPPLHIIEPWYDGSAVAITHFMTGFSPRTSGTITTLDVTALDGRLISRTHCTTVTAMETAVKKAVPAPGLYIATLRNNRNHPVRSMRFLVN